LSERLGGGASIFQGLGLGEVLSAEAQLRPTEAVGRHPPEIGPRRGDNLVSCSDQIDETDRRFL